MASFKNRVCAAQNTPVGQVLPGGHNFAISGTDSLAGGQPRGDSGPHWACERGDKERAQSQKLQVKSEKHSMTTSQILLTRRPFPQGPM